MGQDKAVVVPVGLAIIKVPTFMRVRHAVVVLFQRNS